MNIQNLLDEEEFDRLTLTRLADIYGVGLLIEMLSNYCFTKEDQTPDFLLGELWHCLAGQCFASAEAVRRIEKSFANEATR